jgi:hypothetical protein
LMDPSALLVTPGQQYESQWLANQLAAAPNPAEAAAAEMAAISGGFGQGQRRGGGGGGAYVTGGGGSGLPWHLRPENQLSETPGAVVFRPSGAGLTDWSSYNPAGAYDRWAGTQPVVMGNMTAQSGAPEGTFYNPATNQSQYNYGMPDYYDDLPAMNIPG